MKTAALTHQVDVGSAEIPLQPASLDTWDRKYRLRTESGEPVDQDPLGTLTRVSKALADVELTDQSLWEERFIWALSHGAMPAGRILSNAGAQRYKPGTSAINCTVSRTIQDSMQSILGEGFTEAAMTLKAGSGIGYDFSTLRPAGAFVRGAGATTSGPLTFMDSYNAMCQTISSAGGRRGAQMATFDVRHPDVLDFIRAKRENGRLRAFNLSVLITDRFMHAVRAKEEWPLIFPAMPHEISDESSEIVYDHWPNIESFYTLDDQGRVACRVYKRIKADRLWNLIMSSTYDYAEPGFILIDHVNDMNNNWFCEDIRASNPCGEQMLPPHGACLLGSVDLTKFIKNPFSSAAAFDYELFQDVVRIFTRMLDNVVEINGLPLEQQQAEILRKRRHGMGYTGLGSALAMLGIRYGSDEAIAFTGRVSRDMAITGYETGLALANEKGPAPIMDELFDITAEMLAKRPELVEDGYCVGDRLPGRVLWARYSRYLDKLPESLRNRLMESGCRFTHHTSIAPTGTISLSFGNNCSNGIEPSFSHTYKRNMIVPGKKAKESVDVESFEYLLYKKLVDQDAKPDELPESFATSDSIDPKDHVRMQAAAQKWVDSSISKTINVATDCPFADFQDLYWDAWDQGLKGCTTFRYNPEIFQGVLVRDEDLANTKYRFNLKDGTSIEVSGNTNINYEDDIFTAANLADAIKEGMFGRY